MQHVKKSSSAHFKTFFQQIRYFCDLSQYSSKFAILKTDGEKFTSTYKNVAFDLLDLGSYTNLVICICVLKTDK